MDHTPLVDDLVETGARFLQEFGKKYPIAVAFWLKDKDERRWYLHVASEKIRDGAVRDAYGDVLAVTAQMKDDYFDPFNIKLRKMDDPIVRFALDFQKRYPGKIMTVFNVPTFEGVEVEGMRLYPVSVSALVAP
jgi:hypothetical protein